LEAADPSCEIPGPQGQGWTTWENYPARDRYIRPERRRSDILPLRQRRPTHASTIARELVWLCRPVTVPSLIFNVRLRGHALGSVALFLWPRVSSTRLAPALNAATGTQQEILEDQLAFTRRQWTPASAACDLTINGFRTGFLSNQPIQRIAVRTGERRLDGRCHGTPPRECSISNSVYNRVPEFQCHQRVTMDRHNQGVTSNVPRIYFLRPRFFP
jgi:hypothetical protein